MTDQLEGQMTIFDLDSQFGKMLPEPSLPERREVRTLKKSLKSSPKSSAPMCLVLRYRKTDGLKQDASMMRWEDGALLGEYTTRSFGEYPSEENASHLSQILQECVHPRYSLSERAAAGILRRAEKRGKVLPDILREALENVVDNGQGDNG